MSRFALRASTSDHVYELHDARLNDAPYAVFTDIVTANAWAQYLNAAYPHGVAFTREDMATLLARNPTPPRVVVRDSNGANVATRDDQR